MQSVTGGRCPISPDFTNVTLYFEQNANVLQNCVFFIILLYLLLITQLNRSFVSKKATVNRLATTLTTVRFSNIYFFSIYRDNLAIKSLLIFQQNVRF